MYVLSFVSRASNGIKTKAVASPACPFLHISSCSCLDINHLFLHKPPGQLPCSPSVCNIQVNTRQPATQSSQARGYHAAQEHGSSCSPALGCGPAEPRTQPLGVRPADPCNRNHGTTTGTGTAAAPPKQNWGRTEELGEGNWCCFR